MTESIVTPLATPTRERPIYSNLSIATATTRIISLADKISLCEERDDQVGV